MAVSGWRDCGAVSLFNFLHFELFELLTGQIYALKFTDIYLAVQKVIFTG